MNYPYKPVLIFSGMSNLILFFIKRELTVIFQVNVNYSILFNILIKLHCFMPFSFLQRTSVYLLIFSSLLCFSQTKFEMQDIFSLQYADEIQLSPDGKTIVYRKMGFDIMEDKSVVPYG